MIPNMNTVFDYDNMKVIDMDYKSSAPEFMDTIEEEFNLADMVLVKPSILVVDDDLMCLESLKVILQQVCQGYELEFASDGQ